ncbi:MAG: hypothetical protein ACLGJC_00500 [Alphaproteobacteria bacterium]
MRAALPASLNGAPARSRCIAMDHATFTVEEDDKYRVGQTVFTRMNGLGMAGTVDRVDPRSGTMTFA